MALSGREWTLTEAARSLGEPQHRLIYLCEKGVVQPDLEEAKGRGSSRRFSARNLLEFAVALHLRELELPASIIGAVTYTLRAFERKVQAQMPTFRHRICGLSSAMGACTFLWGQARTSLKCTAASTSRDSPLARPLSATSSEHSPPSPLPSGRAATGAMEMGSGLPTGEYTPAWRSASRALRRNSGWRADFLWNP